MQFVFKTALRCKQECQLERMRRGRRREGVHVPAPVSDRNPTIQINKSTHGKSYKTLIISRANANIRMVSNRKYCPSEHLPARCRNHLAHPLYIRRLYDNNSSVLKRLTHMHLALLIHKLSFVVNREFKKIKC